MSEHLITGPEPTDSGKLAALGLEDLTLEPLQPLESDQISAYVAQYAASLDRLQTSRQVALGRRLMFDDIEDEIRLDERVKILAALLKDLGQNNAVVKVNQRLGNQTSV